MHFLYWLITPGVSFSDLVKILKLKIFEAENFKAIKGQIHATILNSKVKGTVHVCQT